MKRSAGIAGAALVAAVALGLAVLAGAGPDEGLINVGLTSAGARVEAESQFSPAHAGSNAADGRMESGNGCWYSRDQSKLPVALTFRFAQAEEVRRVVVWQARWTGNMYHTRDFALETSQDGKAWSRVAAGSLADDNEARAELPVSFKAPWARIVVLTSYNDFQTCGLAEVEFMARRPLAFGTPAARLDGVDAAWSLPFCGLTLAGTDRGAQAAATPGSFLADLPAAGAAELGIPVAAAEQAFTVSGKLEAGGGRVDAALYQGNKLLWEAKGAEGPARVTARCEPGAGALRVVLRAAGGPVSARLSGWSATMGALTVALPLAPPPGSNYLARTPVYRPAVERALIEWDWRQQDGLGTPNEPVTPAAAAAKAVARLERLAKGADDSGTEARATNLARAALQACGAALAAARRSGTDEAYEAAYLRARWASRRLLLARAGDRIRPLVFAKQAPGVFSHQLTQYYGRYARPGGGIVTLANPGQAMAVRSLTGALGKGSVMQPDVSWDGKRILFTFCATDSDPVDTVRGQYGRYYSLYAVNADGSGLRRLTSGPNDDFAPRWLPDGKYVCVSTRRGGWHRCGTPGCENYTLAVAAGEGAVPVPISYHETQEWDPAVLHDGRIVYTRWDYVDRHPVFYEHLWTTNPDGTRAAILSGNATFNPVGIWEPQAVPGSNLIMATAAAHHAMTAGSVILVDPTKGPDSKSALIRLTPETPFPESEATVTPNWRATMPGTTPLETVESRRWPGHSYRSPFPLAEDLFLASFSYIELLGEPRCNAPGMFGLYLCDAYGNREMLYRDPNISSVWAMPLRPRPMPRRISSPLARSMGDEGLMLLQDVYHASPALPRGSVKSLRIVQILPKSTPGKDLPAVGVPSGSPGKQVLGTVPVEADGSAYFRLPARREVALQALDHRGMAVQIMRSGIYVQPGERASCSGCHERRTSGPLAAAPMASRRAPSRILPGPDGSKPMSYPILVQPVLDKLCVSCHSGPKPGGGVELTGRIDGHYTASYNAMSARVPYSDMNNSEPVSRPGRYGSTGSSVMKLVLAGHGGVKASPADIERLATWMDAGAIFYGTFDREQQALQQAGGRLTKPVLE
ncbi:MAG: hypothetical protein NT029_06965 [Armatimonadetes bacterium]|nr:hypothetical protein [Armatimonadota bacterium]